MEFPRRGSHSPAAWREWRRRNVEVIDSSSGADRSHANSNRSTVSTPETRVRIATEDHPVYLEPTPILENATIRRLAPSDGSSGTPPNPSDGSLAVVDVAIDSCGHRFLLTDDGEIYRHVPEERTLTPLGCLFRGGGDPRAVAVTETTLYVARGEPAAVHAYSRELGQTRWIIEADVDDPITFVRDRGDLYLLDAGGRRGDGTLSRIHRRGGLEPIVTGLYEPIDADVDTDGSLYVLEPQLRGDPEVGSRFLIRRLDRRVLDRSPVPAAETVWIPPDAFRIRATGERFVPGCLAVGAPGELLVGVAPGSDSEHWLLGYRADAAAFDYHSRFPEGCLSLSLDPSCGDRTLLVVDGTRRLFGVDPSEATRRDRVTGGFEGFLRRRFDAGEDGTQWHRLSLAIDYATDTEIRLQYRATDVDPWTRPVAAGSSPAGSPHSTRFDPDAERGDLLEIDGIGPRKAWRLRQAGIADLAALADSDPRTIATILSLEEIQVGRRQVREWLTRAESLLADYAVDGTDDDAVDGTELELVDGIGPVRASRLRAAGVADLAELVALDVDLISALLTRELRTVSTARTGAWIKDARKRLRELPEEPTFATGEEWTTVSTTRPQDVLLEGATGRYLQVQLRLVGTEGSSPTVTSLDASYPRQSYLEELPAVYREDEQTSAFLERFLALFERIFTDVDAGIDDLTSYLDPAGIPAEPGYLDWLGDFLAAEIDETWPDAATREFIDRAPELYRKRGTRGGLQATIDLYLSHVDVDRAAWDRVLSIGDGSHTVEEPVDGDQSATRPIRLVRVIEHAELDCLDDGDVRVPYDRLISCPQGFLVLLHPCLDAEHVRTIGRIVRHQRPAHASGRAVALRPLTVLTGTERGERGFHTYLGVNTVLPSREFTLEEATLGQETVLGDREPDGSLGEHSRLDEDARLS